MSEFSPEHSLYSLESELDRRSLEMLVSCGRQNGVAPIPTMHCATPFSFALEKYGDTLFLLALEDHTRPAARTAVDLLYHNTWIRTSSNARIHGSPEFTTSPGGGVVLADGTVDKNFSHLEIRASISSLGLWYIIFVDHSEEPVYNKMIEIHRVTEEIGPTIAYAMKQRLTEQ